jgi:hypothetical protein
MYWYAIWHGFMLLVLTFYTLDESSGETREYDEETGKWVSKTISGTVMLDGTFIF